MTLDQSAYVPYSADGAAPTSAPAMSPAPNPFDASQVAAAAAAAASAGGGAPSAPAASAVDEAAAALDAFAAVNLDEVVIGSVTVPFVEWDRAPDAPEGAPPTARMVKKTIQNFVPMLVFNRSVKLFQQLGTIKDQEEQLAIMASAVLLVWQLSEPEMTLQRLLMGLDFMVLMKLFNDFFAAKLRRIGIKVGAAGILSNGQG